MLPGRHRGLRTCCDTLRCGVRVTLSLRFDGSMPLSTHAFAGSDAFTMASSATPGDSRHVQCT